MSHIAFELDAFPLVPKVARSAGVAEAVVGWGLPQMWEWCWRAKTDTVTNNHLRGFFGAEFGAVLVDFGFLEAAGSGIWRVRGAVRYLRIQEGRSRGGKAAAAAGNLKRGSARPAEVPPEGEPQLPPSLPPAQPQAFSDKRLATSEQRQAKEEEETPPPKITTPGRPPLVPREPDDPYASGEAWWAHVQHQRHNLGGVVERPPDSRTLSVWWSEVGMELNGEYQLLEPALARFGANKFWESKDPPWPFTAFMKNWRDYVRRA